MIVEDKIWHQVFERDGGRCRYCDMDFLKSFASYQNSSVDHVIARSVGGSDHIDNLALCCHGCNSRLSRASNLRTVEERRSLIQDERNWGGAGKKYNEYLNKLKNGWKRDQSN
jgi:5-methylcytosine-specific restriction endonuclease McrA